MVHVGGEAERPYSQYSSGGEGYGQRKDTQEGLSSAIPKYLAAEFGPKDL